MIYLLWATLARAGDPCSDSDAILAIYKEGESERENRVSTATSVLKRDEKRVKQMVAFDRKGHLCSADDKWYAAWVMMQSDDLAIIERGHALAIEAMDAAHPNGPWLVAYSFDRKRVLGGYRQSYGTQTRVNERGQRCLIEVDPEITDEARKGYAQPPIAEVYRKLLDQHGFSSDAATLERLTLRGLSCPPLAISKKAQKRVAAPD